MSTKTEGDQVGEVKFAESVEERLTSKPSTMTITVDEIILKEHRVETKWKDGCPLNFHDADILVFETKQGKFTYKKV